MVLVGADAGYGKSSLIERFTLVHWLDARALWGACDSLATPSALAPVREIAAQTPLISSAVAAESASRDRLFHALFDELVDSKQPSIVVLEDVHWADQATLDFLRFLGRRIQRTAALFIATYRLDEVSANHPLRQAIGDLTGHHVTRMRLPPLWAGGESAWLAQQTGLDAALLHQITGGNPFFVREVLASHDERVPETVRYPPAAARLVRCAIDTRALAEFVSMSPSRTEVWLIESALGPHQAALDEAGARGPLASPYKATRSASVTSWRARRFTAPFHRSASARCTTVFCRCYWSAAPIQRGWRITRNWPTTPRQF